MLTCPVYKAVVNSDQMMGKKNHFTTDQIPNLILLELSAQKKKVFLWIWCLWMCISFCCAVEITVPEFNNSCFLASYNNLWKRVRNMGLLLWFGINLGHSGGRTSLLTCTAKAKVCNPLLGFSLSSIIITLGTLLMWVNVTDVDRACRTSSAELVFALLRDCSFV